MFFDSKVNTELAYLPPSLQESLLNHSSYLFEYLEGWFLSPNETTLLEKAK